jgi:hypothetical protein
MEKARCHTEKAEERHQSAIELVIIRFLLSEAVFLLLSGSQKIKNWKLRHGFKIALYIQNAILNLWYYLTACYKCYYLMTTLVFFQI